MLFEPAEIGRPRLCFCVLIEDLPPVALLSQTAVQLAVSAAVAEAEFQERDAAEQLRQIAHDERDAAALFGRLDLLAAFSAWLEPPVAVPPAVGDAPFAAPSQPWEA